MNKICFVLDTHYPNYTKRLKTTSLKNYIDLNLQEFGIHFLISTNRPQDFEEYKSEYIHIFDINELRKDNEISLKYEIFPEDPTGIYPAKFPWNVERFILRKAAEMGFNYIINLDSDVIFDERYSGLNIKNELDSIFEENTVSTNQAIYALCKMKPIMTNNFSLEDTAALYSLAHLVLTIDSMSTHLASATQTPVISVFGPSNEKNWGPWGGKHRVIALTSQDAPTFACRPCGQDGCEGSKISQCLVQMNPSMIIHEALKMLH